MRAFCRVFSQYLLVSTPSATVLVLLMMSSSFSPLPMRRPTVLFLLASPATNSSKALQYPAASFAERMLMSEPQCGCNANPHATWVHVTCLCFSSLPNKYKAQSWHSSLSPLRQFYFVPSPCSSIAVTAKFSSAFMRLTHACWAYGAYPCM